MRALAETLLLLGPGECPPPATGKIGYFQAVHSSLGAVHMSKPGLVNRATTMYGSISWTGQPGEGNINSQ